MTLPSEFDTWSIRHGRPDLDFPRPAVAYKTEVVADCFRERGLFLSPRDGTLYESLGTRVRSGDWVGVKNGGHSAFFLYWIKPNENQPVRQTSLIEFMRVLSHSDYKPDDEKPWLFQHTYDINRFRVIGGNQSDAVTVSYAAAVRLPEGHEDWIPYLVGDRHLLVINGSLIPRMALVWTRKADHDDYHDGFGRLSPE